MEVIDNRTAIGQLAADLLWLEEHCRRQPDASAHAGNLRFAAALTRNVIGPFLEGQPAKPLHIAVVGGAGAGKSTVVNFLAGTVVAEANSQAGYTRHPTAYITNDSTDPWPSYLGYLGPLQRVSQDQPANVDEDVYQVHRISPSPSGTNPLADFVVWDCPDMTTWASAGYVARLLEVAALADVIVYVASDERYNDVVPTQFLHLTVRAGKAVVVVLTKARPADADTLADHFRNEVLGRLPPLPDGRQPAIPVIVFPQMTPEERKDPAGAGMKYRVTLLNQVLVFCESPTSARVRTVGNAMKYLTTAGAGLVEYARRDLAELDQWKAVVRAGQAEFEDRYRREFLAGEQFHRFDRYRDQLMETIELPGAGKFLTGALWVLRMPYRFGRDYLAQLIIRPDVLTLAEPAVLGAALSAWLDRLQAEALKRSTTHPIWKGIVVGFDSGLATQTRDRFQQQYRSFELKETDDLERTGQELVDRLEKHPPLLYTLRVGKLATDVVVVGGIVYFTWSIPGWWWLMILIPLGVSATHQVEELVVRSAAETARSRVRQRREELFRADLSEPLAAWMCDWPTTGGSSVERLQQVLQRIPTVIRQLDDRVAARVQQLTPPPEPSPA